MDRGMNAGAVWGESAGGRWQSAGKKHPGIHGRSEAGYFLSLALSFFVPNTFTAIAFDSGGVASGPLTAAFMLPFAMGAVSAMGGNVMTDAFGLVALVAMMPLITVQVMGVVSVVSAGRGAAVQTAPSEFGKHDIIELWEM